MITAANVAFGMYWNVVVKNPRANKTIIPVITPQVVVLAPDALLRAVLVKEPVIGIEEKNELIMLHSPKAITSWVASRGRPLAETINELVISYIYIYI